MISKALEKAQQKVEEHHFDARKSVLKFDNVMNDQRKVIYSQRKELMDVDDVSETIKDMREEYICSIINSYMPYGSAREDWLKEDLQKELLRATGFILPIINWANEPEMDVQEMTQRILDEVEARLKEKNKNVDPELIKIIEKSTLLQVLDQLWKEHIATLDLMRQTIGLRAYGQKDPLNEYKKEAFNMFSMLLASLKEMVTVVICRAGIPDNAQRTMERAQPSRQNIKISARHVSKFLHLAGEWINKSGNSFFVLFFFKGEICMKKKEIVKNETKKNTAVKIPILSIRIMTDEEWNRLAYKNMLKRNGVA